MVINLQDSQLKLESSSFYINSEFLVEKFRRLSIEKIAKIFLKSWHPTIELEGINPKILKDAISYWGNLLPIKERWRMQKLVDFLEPNYKRVEELEKIGIISKEFIKELEALWKEIIERNKTGKVDYWNFIRCKEYSKTVERAYLTSFLITYGYVDLLEKSGKLFLIPKEKQETRKNNGFFSIPISIEREKLQ
jgi:response regulator RpfG family c-di-GMP phosphodiesterase